MINQTQNKRIHALLNSTGFMPQKSSLVTAASAGRTESCRELDYNEAVWLINYLEKVDVKDTQAIANSANKQRRRIIAEAHKMDWKKANGTLDMPRLNNWCIEKSYLKKPLMDYTAAELPKLINQITAVRKSVMKKVNV